MVHFRREKYVPFGGPDGGDGGKGGDIVLEVRRNLNTLSTYRHQSHYSAENGSRGGKQNMTGRSGDDLILYVPPGTIAFNDERGTIIGDLLDQGQRLIIAHGGRGGRGNARFATARNQAPRIAERGEPGRDLRLRLELKLIADVGIVGVPNAGKSTLLAAVTNARPKIAPYPFTTLEPNLGVAELDDDTSLVLADIPGLIEGAHQGVGLGHSFLRHIQRTRVLIHLIDGLAEDPMLDYAQINSELVLFDPELAKKPQIVAISKIDLPEVQRRLSDIKARFTKHGQKPIEISAIAQTNIRKLLYKTSMLLDETTISGERVALPTYRVESDPREYEIHRRGDGWHVDGEAIERAAAMTYWEYDQSVQRFQVILRALGIEDDLRQAGIKVGDTVRIGEHELEWQE